LSQLIKKRRGGQPGNHNARTHGFYSHTLLPSEICELISITNKEGLDGRTAVLRIKMKSVYMKSPGNTRVINEALKVLGRWEIEKSHLNSTDAAVLKKGIKAMFRNKIPSFCKPGASVPGSLQNDCKVSSIGSGVKNSRNEFPTIELKV
jgi:hypothetical protein